MPAERVTTSYARLFEIRILHHYWLDDGSTLFDDLTSDDQQERLRTYDVRTILRLQPTQDTQRIITGLRGVWSMTSLGFMVGVPATKAIPDDLIMDFTVHLVDPNYLSYTAYGLQIPTSANVFQTTTKRTFRYRANAALYSNLTGATRGGGPTKTLFLAHEYAARTAADRVEFIVNDAGALVQLTSDPPTSNAVTLAASASDQPVYATHADVPPIIPPSNIVGTVPPRGIELPEGAGSDVHALIRIGMVHGSDPDMSCISGGFAKSVPPTLQLRLKNRRSMWRYFSKSDPATQFSESGPNPLTYRGNPAGTHKPPIGRVSLDGPSTAITNIVSEVYI